MDLWSKDAFFPWWSWGKQVAKVAAEGPVLEDTKERIEKLGAIVPEMWFFKQVPLLKVGTFSPLLLGIFVHKVSDYLMCLNEGKKLHP